MKAVSAFMVAMLVLGACSAATPAPTETPALTSTPAATPTPNPSPTAKAPASATPTAPPTATPAPSAEVTVNVDGTDPYPPGVVAVAEGQPVLVSAAGSWCTPGCAGPGGERMADAGELVDLFLPDAPIGALIGQIDDGPYFLIGQSLLFAAGQSGSLRLLMNDRECCFGDNSGSIEATIATWPIGAIVTGETSPTMPPVDPQTGDLLALLDEDHQSATLRDVRSAINDAYDAHPDLAGSLWPTSDFTYRELALYRDWYGCGPWEDSADYEYRSLDCGINFETLVCSYRITSDDLFLMATGRLLGYMSEINSAALFLTWLDDLRERWTAPPDPRAPSCGT